jgi:hypothetical protein
MNVVIMIVGTRGDVQPFFGLGELLLPANTHTHSVPHSIGIQQVACTRVFVSWHMAHSLSYEAASTRRLQSLVDALHSLRGACPCAVYRVPASCSVTVSLCNSCTRSDTSALQDSGLLSQWWRYPTPTMQITHTALLFAGLCCVCAAHTRSARAGGRRAPRQDRNAQGDCTLAFKQNVSPR